MLRRLKIKMTAAIVAVSAAVCLAAFCAIMVSSHHNLYEPIHNALVSSVDHGPGADFVPVIGRPSPSPGAEPPPREDHMPTAVASVRKDGAVVQANPTFDHMDQALCAAAVEHALESPDDEGYMPGGQLFYFKAAKGDVTVIALADAAGFVDTLKKTALSVSLVFLCVVCAAGVLALGLSNVITQPVQRAWDKQGEFIADASHELKTPLTVILANTNILRGGREALTQTQAKWVDGIHDEANHMKRLVEELLFLAKSDGSTTGARPACDPLDFSNLVTQACLTFDAVAFEAGVELRESVEQGLWVEGDRAQAERLVRVLIDNAVKYAGEGGTVFVELRSKKMGRRVLSVTNSGPCIPPQDLARVFDRFWRSDQARSRTQNPSYGLGLSIAKSIADAHGWRIAATSSPERGTTFTVAL